MPNTKQVKCSICNGPIKTTFGAAALKSTQMVCRRCFGDQTYAGSSQWTYNAMNQEPTHHDG